MACEVFPNSRVNRLIRHCKKVIQGIDTYAHQFETCKMKSNDTIYLIFSHCGGEGMLYLIKLLYIIYRQPSMSSSDGLADGERVL